MFKKLIRGRPFKLEKHPQAPSSSQQTIPATSCDIPASQDSGVDGGHAATSIGSAQQGLQRIQGDESPQITSQTKAGEGARSYCNITVGGSSRNVLGDVHTQSVAFNSYHAPPAVQQSKGEALMTAFAFDVMGSRLATITPAYANTCLWILETPEYIKWKDPQHRGGSHHGILWIKGNPGTGKSTLMKCVLEHAQERWRQQELVVSYFFNARGFDIEKSAEGMYRSLLHQILQAHPQLRRPLSDRVMITKSHTWSIGVLQDLLRATILSVGPDEHLTCYIDALDECQIEEVRQAISNFEDLCALAYHKNIRFSICFASRYYPHVFIAFHEAIRLDAQKEHEDDISKYVRKN